MVSLAETINNVDLHLQSKVNFVSFVFVFFKSLLGFTKQIKHLDGHYVNVESSTVQNCESEVIIKNEGMCDEYDSCGNLIVNFEINFPRNVDQESNFTKEKFSDVFLFFAPGSFRKTTCCILFSFYTYCLCLLKIHKIILSLIRLFQLEKRATPEFLMFCLRNTRHTED